MKSTKFRTIWSYKCSRMQFLRTLTTRKIMRPSMISVNGKTEKISIVSVSNAKDHSRIVSHSCILKGIKTITIRYPKLDQFGSLGIHLWSDGCSAQFWSRFVFQLTTLFPSRINVIRFYNDRHHGKGPVDDIGGCIKNAVYRAVMAEKLLYTLLDFTKSAQKLVKWIECVYLPEKGVIIELDKVKNTHRAPKYIFSKFIWLSGWSWKVCFHVYSCIK